MKNTTTMRKKHPKTREERRIINKTKQQGEKKVQTKPSIQTLETTISFSNLSDQVIAFMDYVGLLPEDAEVVSVNIEGLIRPLSGIIPVKIEYTTKGVN